MKIYLAGSVPKGDKEARSFDNWRERYQTEINKYTNADYIDPYKRNLDESDFLCIFGKDCLQIKSSDLVVVYAEKQLGVGTSQELILAKMFSKPVVVILPKNTHHRRSNIIFREKNIEDWIHPFIYAFSDFIIEDISEINDVFLKLNETKIKDISIVEQAMKYCESVEGSRQSF